MTALDCNAYPDLDFGLPAPGGLPAFDCDPAPSLPPNCAQFLAQGKVDSARAGLVQWSDAGATPIEQLQRRLLSAYGLWRAGCPGPGLELLHQALILGREHRLCSGLLGDPPGLTAGALAALCALALERDMEPCYVRRLIQEAGLTPPSPNLARWPYPVRLYTLGQWSVLVQGQPLHFSGKAQRRPLWLLQHLLAKGGRPVPVALLRKAMDEASEDGDGHFSRGAFDMALNRLRHLLPVPDLVQLNDGLLSLNESLCWVDAWACERLLLRADQALEVTCGLRLFERALALFEGDFLAGEDSAWALLARERIRARLLRVARRLGQSLEAEGRWAESGALFERLREIFPLDEDVCLHLIRSHVKREEFAQATHLYGRCRDLLAKVLGVLPNPAIRALVQTA